MIFVEIVGSRLEVASIAGPAGLAPLVFLHEGLGSVSLWTQRGRNWPVAVCQATGRAGLVYSRRGYGQSDAVPDVRGSGRLTPDYMHREAWEVLPALLAALGIARPVLVGHSGGASIALLHASQHPVSAAVVMAPHVMVEDIAVQAIAEAKSAFESGELRARLARPHGATRRTGARRAADRATPAASMRALTAARPARSHAAGDGGVLAPASLTLICYYFRSCLRPTHKGWRHFSLIFSPRSAGNAG